MARPGAMLEIPNDFLPGQYFILHTGYDYVLHVAVGVKVSVSNGFNFAITLVGTVYVLTSFVSPDN